MRTAWSWGPSRERRAGARSSVAPAPPTAPASRPPIWLIVATGVLALIILALAVAETNLRAHYLIDEGEYLSMFGLAFILGRGNSSTRAVACSLRSGWCFRGCFTRSSRRAIN